MTDATSEITRKLARLTFLVMLFCGIIFYIGWSALYSTWTDIGVYSVSISLVGLGLSGMFLFSKKTYAVEEGEQES